MSVPKSMDPTKIHKYFKNQLPPKISQLKVKYTDPYFPPNLNSLLSKNEKGEYLDKSEGKSLAEELGIKWAKSLEWKRASTLSEDMKIFGDKIYIKEISQGSIGDCYFLSSLAALSAFPYLLREKFRLSEPNKYGYIEVILFLDGEWQIVFVDDYLPCSGGCVFAHPYENIYWACILEKVWAKVNGGYSNIIGGYTSEAIEILTGLPCEEHYHYNMSTEELFKLIESGNSKMLMTASSNKDEMGIVGNHAYTVIQAKKWEERGIYLVMVRNPWGHGEWKGKWSDNSNAWTKELINYFKMVNKEDGIFWMSIEDFKKYFSYTSICHLMFDSIFKHYHFEYDKYFQYPNVFNFHLSKKGKISIRVIFKQKRFHREVKSEYHSLGLSLGKYNSQREIIKTYKISHGWNSQNYIEDLDEGYYVLITYVDYNKVKDTNFSYSLQITSENQTNFVCEYMGLDKTFLFTQYFILSAYEVEYPHLLKNQDYHINQMDLGGFSGLVVYNFSNKCLNCTITGDRDLFPPFNEEKEYDITIPPKQRIAILGVNCYSISISSRLSNNYSGPSISSPKFDGFLSFNLSNDISDTIGIRTHQYKYISQKSIWEIPSFESNEFIEISNEILRKSSLTFVHDINEPVNLKDALKNYKKELELMIKEFPPRESDKNIKIHSNTVNGKSGTYIGEIRTDNERFHGRGIFIWLSGVKYIGYWTNSQMDTKGLIIDKDNNKLYYGGFNNGLREGQGELYYPEKEKYIGTFKSNKKEGIGIYYYSNGSSWKGKFKNDMKDGVGLFTKKDGGKLYIEFEKDHVIGRYEYKGEEDQFSNPNDNDNNEKINDIRNNIIKKNEIVSTFIVKPGNNNKKIEEAKQYNFYLSRTKELSEKEPFMLGKVLSLNNNVHDFLTLNISGGIKFLGVVNSEKKKNGRGILFKNNKYYLGFFFNDSPIGIFDIFDKNKKKIFTGELDNDYNLNKKSNIKIFYPNGYIYYGEHINNIPNGLGILYYDDGTSWSGNFKDGKFEGEGKFFFINGCISQLITYKDNNLISKKNTVIDDYNIESNKEFFEKLSNKDIKRKLLSLKCYRESKSELKYITLNLPNNNIYHGQVDKNNKKCGKGCIIYNNAKERYYIGYFENNEINGEGTIYNVNWEIIYKGNFKNGLKFGFGTLYHYRGTYSGEFFDDLPNGKGVFYYPNQTYYEGNFLKGLRHGKGFLININDKTIKEYVYCKNNIIEQKPTVSSNTFINAKNTSLNMIKNLYPELVKSFMNFKETEDSIFLKYNSYEDDNGCFYVGEVNNIGFKHGRGVLIYPNKKRRYIGYFKNNMKENQGALFSDEETKEYVGNFNYDKINGEGTYYLKNGNKIKGSFNEIGEGNGEILFNNKEKWAGNFYGLFMNGSGNYFDTNGNKNTKSYNMENTFN